MAITVVKVEDLESYVGKELGATDWFKIDQERINSFRKDFEKNSNERTLKQFFIDQDYGIPAVDNSLLSQTEILVLELDDRSVNENGNATQDITDIDIIELFWSDWLTKSNVKKFELLEEIYKKQKFWAVGSDIKKINVLIKEVGLGFN